MSVKIKSFDLRVSELKDTLQKAVSSYSPNEIRSIVNALFAGKNYRGLTEKPTRQSISVFAGWILNLTHRASLAFGSKWQESLLEIVSRKGSSQPEKWLNFWLLGLAQKTAVNIGLKRSSQNHYQKDVMNSTQQIVCDFKWETSTIELSSVSLQNTKLSTSDSVWLMQIAGAAVLTIRGSKKSTAGKLLEKAIARAALTVLGLEENTHFWLNIGRDREVEREVDAEVLTRRGRTRIDIALIGVGNQEVSEDKLARVGRHGIVLVDSLGPRSQVLKNAAIHGVEVIQLRNNFALNQLYIHLEPLMPTGVKLRKPPASEAGLTKILNKLPDSVFSIPSVSSLKTSNNKSCM